MAFRSPMTRVLVPREPVRTPLTARPPASTQIMLSPRLLICCWICSEAPSPTATLAITAPTPIMIPSMVRMLRILLRARARMANRRMLIRSIRSLLFWYCCFASARRQCCQNFGGASAIAYRRIAQNLAVAKQDCAPRETCHVWLVCDQQNGQPAFVVETLKRVHNFYARPRVQIAGGLVGQQDGR